MKKIKLIALLLQISALAYSQTLNLPSRSPSALTGSEFVSLVWSYSLTDREDEIYAQVMSGNIPEFQRNLVEISFDQTINDIIYNVIYYVLPDYLAIGCDTNYFLCPMTPILAQRLCNKLKCIMPTRKMVDQIWSSATVKLSPSTIPPSPEMITIPVMYQHNQTVWGQRHAVIVQHPLGELVGGDKKDVVISNKIYGNPAPKRVVIYGWHYVSGSPIQPLYSGHEETYADYSHGIRLVQDSVIINGQSNYISSILQNDTLYSLFSDEGLISQPYYPLSATSLNPPSAFGVISRDSSSLELIVKNNPDVTGYLVYLSGNGVNFSNYIAVSKEIPIIDGLTKDSLYFVKIKAVGESDTSGFSEVLAGTPTDDEVKILVVNGYDRNYSGNTYNFIRQHGGAIKKCGYKFNSASNEAVAYGLFNLNNYRTVDWILGLESTANETFSSSEQSIVSAFLNNGGTLFVSGAEIAWDLDFKGSTSDKNFFWNYLKSEYINDAPNGSANTYYRAEGITGTLFDGTININFDNGSYGTYSVSYPDVINGVNGGVNALKYSEISSNNIAGVSYKGLFPGGSQNGALVYIGFPFETIYPESKRLEVMEKILEYFEDLTSVNDGQNVIVDQYELRQNYPNPFNPTTNIMFALPKGGRVKLSVYNMLGQEIAVLFNGYKEAGVHTATWNAGNFSSGIYIYKLETDVKIFAKKMTLLK